MATTSWTSRPTSRSAATSSKRSSTSRLRAAYQPATTVRITASTNTAAVRG
ncbi:hypothetical protein [Nostocoides sp. HKS02]|uniref:hypothetical protein n=1 Tax=Nostocoides sp. HKS02 TaxID=1813880 RepID=UPI0012B4F534|nr:hypothetical protein [Tetrasphaera sp. HKS02]QGN57654.1 hypothetical protein GKE56_06955 [Tetrasphaera sp. HKS02]